MYILYTNTWLRKIFSGVTILFVASMLLGAQAAMAAASSSAETSTSTRSRSGPQAPARQDSFMGTGNTSTGGFSTTYTDPQTGDVITRVVPPQNPNQQQTPVPIYIYPQVEPQWPPKNNQQPNPVPTPPRQSGNPSLYQPYGN